MRFPTVLRLLIPVCCLLAGYPALQAQPTFIQGVHEVRANNYNTYTYRTPDGSSATWNVGGGTKTFDNGNTIKVQWATGASSKYVNCASATWGNQTLIITDAGPLSIGTAQAAPMPAYNTPSNVLFNFTTLPGFPTYTYPSYLTYTYVTYQWFQVIQGGGGGSGPIPGGSSPSVTTSVTMSSNTNPNIYYCILTFHEVPQYGDEIVTSFSAGIITLQLALLDPGILSKSPGSPANLASGATPQVSQVPAYGGMCIPADYAYEWFVKKDNDRWEFIGDGVNFPGGVTVNGGSLLTVKRKVTCNNESAYTPELSWNITSYTSVDFENMNYTRENTILKPGIKSWEQSDPLAIGDKLQSTAYQDGMSRTIQTVDKGISAAANNTWKDRVKHYEYDEAGRSIQDFLPYASSDNPGKFKTNAASAQPVYIRSFFGEPSDAPTASIMEYDNSPLNKVKKMMGAGKSWAGSSKGTSFTTEYNTDVEKVHSWTLAYSSSALPVTGPGIIYSTGTLTKNSSKDENDNKVVSYTDMSGNLVLKKVQQNNDAQLSIEHSGWICTYYVYDDFGRLRYTITPKAVSYLDNNGWNLTQTLADQLCYKYLYDNKGRPSVKKQPGADEVWIIYDRKDRVVFTQDGAQRPNKQWTTTLYDILDRPLITGVTTLATNVLLSDMQFAVSEQTKTPLSPNTSVPLDRILNNSNTSGTFPALRSITTTDEFVTPDGVEFVAEIVSGTSGSDGETTVIEGVPVDKNPIPSTADFLPLKVNYYDSYDYAGAKSFTNTYSLAYTAISPISPTVKTNRIKGLITGEKVRVLDGDNNNSNDKFLISTAYYDEQGRTVETLTDNIKNGLDYEVRQYDFSDKIVSSYSSHNSGSGITYTTISKKEFDKIGRLIKLHKNFNNSFYKQLAEYSYDELGQLKVKRLAPGYTGTGGNEIEALTYDYNIKGWLTGINKDYALGDNTYTQWDRYFGLYLGYDNQDNKFNSQQLNGNLTGVSWRSQGDNSPRKFDYIYDRLDQLTTAAFKQRKKPADATWSSTEVDFSTTVEYEDGNGNLRSMKHMGIIPGVNNGVAVDDLRYTYLPTGILGLNGNQLKQVDEQGALSATNNGLLGDFKEVNTAQDYYYDVNGNVVKDLNKNIKTGASNGITYNYMNKPVKIIIEGKSTIEFVYDATGEKLQKKVTYADNSVRLTTYIGDYVYEQFTPAGGGGVESLLYVAHEEGRIKIITPHSKVNNNDYDLNAGAAGLAGWPGGKQGVFEYFIKDNLGNTRMVLTEEIQKEYYKATMDVGVASQEEPLFGQVDVNGNPTAANELQKTRLSVSGIWPGNSTDASKLTALFPDKVIGPNMVLKVMAGDVITGLVNYYYANNNSTGSNGLLNSIGSSLINSLSGVQSSALGKNQSGLINSNFTGNNELITLLNNRNLTGIAPKAYLNIVFLDEQFKYLDKDAVTPAIGTNYARVTTQAVSNASLNLQQKAPKNGWVFIFLSNESNEIVYFDDLVVTQDHSRVSEENHYYPYGLKIAGISSRAVNKLDNKFDYQGGFSEEETETGWNEFDLRMYDPQIGRWTGMDPYDEFPSSYVGLGNNPVNLKDADGGSVWSDLFQGTLASRTFQGALLGTIIGAGAAILSGDIDNIGKYAAYGAVAGGALTFALSSPTNINVQFVPNWDQVKIDKEEHGKKLFRAPYFAAKIRSYLNEIFSLGKIVTITGDGFEAGEEYTDGNNKEHTSKGTLSTNLDDYFKKHPNAKGVANALTEFHSASMGYCSNSGPDQFCGIAQYFNENSTFMYGNCFQADEAVNTSIKLNGATVIGSYTQQLDLPYATIGTLSGNPALAGQNLLVAPSTPSAPTTLNEEFLMHTVAKNGQVVYDGRAFTNISVSGKITYRKISEQQARRMNDVYYRLKGDVFKNILSLLLRKF